MTLHDLKVTRRLLLPSSVAFLTESWWNWAPDFIYFTALCSYYCRNNVLYRHYQLLNYTWSSVSFLLLCHGSSG